MVYSRKDAICLYSSHRERLRGRGSGREVWEDGFWERSLGGGGSGREV